MSLEKNLIIGECVQCEMERHRAEGWGRVKAQLSTTGGNYLILYLVPSFGHARKKGRHKIKNEIIVAYCRETHTHTHMYMYMYCMYVCMYMWCVRVCIVLYRCMIRDAYNCDTLYIYFLVMISH